MIEWQYHRMMKYIRRFLIVIIALASFVGLAFLIVTGYGWEKVWVHAVGPADMGTVVFEELRKTRKPNQALFCPDGLCNDSERDQTSPAYSLSVDELKNAILNVLNNEAGLERVDDRSDPLALRYVARSRLFRFPDTIRIRLFALGNSKSTLAIYSQSQIGQSDFGVNIKRLDRWLAKLKKYESK